MCTSKKLSLDDGVLQVNILGLTFVAGKYGGWGSVRTYNDELASSLARSCYYPSPALVVSELHFFAYILDKAFVRCFRSMHLVVFRTACIVLMPHRKLY